MKTVIDAVNGFNGEFPYDKPSIIYGAGDGRWSDFSCYNDIALTPHWQFVCTEEEFNQCAKEMETNFGASVHYHVYKANFSGDITDRLLPIVEPKEIDWSKAPDGATHYGIESGNYYSGFYKIISSSEGFFHDKDQWLICCTWPELTEKPTPQPTFTQAMADAGELPAVGMDCLIKLNASSQPESCKVIGIFSDDVWVLLYDGNCTHALKIRAGMFKPIDTRTDEEKAIDDLDKLDWFSEHYAIEFIDNVKAGKIHGVKWVGK